MARRHVTLIDLLLYQLEQEEQMEEPAVGDNQRLCDGTCDTCSLDCFASTRDSKINSGFDMCERCGRIEDCDRCDRCRKYLCEDCWEDHLGSEDDTDE